MQKKVMVAMSGGVDSSVAAKLLMEKEYEICGATLRLHDGEPQHECQKTCCAQNDVEDARSVCMRLGIRHYVFNFKERFEKSVIDRFVSEYEQGRTPNPCIDCNRFIKFSEMLSRAQLLSQDFIATGHYARRELDVATGRYLLKRPADWHKDQTYVLYALTENQLRYTLFPLGDLCKDEVRRLAESGGFINANKPDSQDICFVQNHDYAAFIEKYTKKCAKKGSFIDINGNYLGEHKGISSYTVGQRKGLGIAFGKPQFVIEKRLSDNAVVLGDEQYLFSKTAVVDDVNLIAVDRLDGTMKVTAKVRYNGPDNDATIRMDEEGKVLLEFVKPQRAITPGQAAVFYVGDVVIGGGTIL